MQTGVSVATLTVRLPELAPLVPLPLLTPTVLVAWYVVTCVPASAGTGESFNAHTRYVVLGCSEPRVVVVAPLAVLHVDPPPVPKVAVEPPELKLPDLGYLTGIGGDPCSPTLITACDRVGGVGGPFEECGGGPAGRGGGTSRRCGVQVVDI